MGTLNSIYGIIYLIVNKVNGKVYVGQTINLHKRMITYRQRAKKPVVYIDRALHKYGIENFDWTKIDDASSKEELDAKEIHWIAHHKSNDPSIGYNCNTGGSQARPNAESIEKMRHALIEGYASGRLVSHTKGKTFEYELTETVLASRFKKEQTPWNKGQPWSDESKRRMSESQRGNSNKRRETILCIETGEVFYGIHETARRFSLSPGNLSSTLNGKQKTWNGFHWKRVTEPTPANPVVL